MERNRASQECLAGHLGVKRTSLTRFLNGTESFRPKITRPAMMNILEQIESRCAVLNVIREVDLAASAPDGALEDERAVWYGNHLERLRHTQKLEPALALSVVAELYAQALHGPPLYRARMATNTLLYLGGAVSLRGAETATRKLLFTTRTRILHLEACAAEHVEHERDPNKREQIRHRAKGYAGFGLCHAGLLLDDDGLVDGGLERMLDAVALSRAPGEGHWANLVKSLDRMFERGHDLSEGWSRRVAEHALERRGEGVAYTLSTRWFPRVMDHWAAAFPELAALAGPTHERGGRDVA